MGLYVGAILILVVGVVVGVEVGFGVLLLIDYYFGIDAHYSSALEIAT
jgi:hypothetical protein